MKTSKIIFLSLLVTIALFILAAFIDVRINGKPAPTSDLETYETAIPDFKVLAIMNTGNISLTHEKSASALKVNCRKGVTPPTINYSVKNDTMFISDVKQFVNNEILFVTIRVSDTLDAIYVKDSRLNVKSSGSGFKIEAERSNIFITYGNNTTFASANNNDIEVTTINESTYIDHLKIVARDHSSVSLSGFNIGSLDIVLENSEAQISATAKKISGSLSDNSRLSTRPSKEINLKSDESSNYSVSMAAILRNVPRK